MTRCLWNGYCFVMICPLIFLQTIPHLGAIPSCLDGIVGWEKKEQILPVSLGYSRISLERSNKDTGADNIPMETVVFPSSLNPYQSVFKIYLLQTCDTDVRHVVCWVMWCFCKEVYFGFYWRRFCCICVKGIAYSIWKRSLRMFMVCFIYRVLCSSTCLCSVCCMILDSREVVRDIILCQI